MSATLPDKRRELDRLRELSKCEGWKDIVLPKLAALRDAHNEQGMAKNAKPEGRAEHVEAWHMAKDLVAYVPDRIAALTKELAALDKAEGASEPISDALADKS